MQHLFRGGRRGASPRAPYKLEPPLVFTVCSLKTIKRSLFATQFAALSIVANHAVNEVNDSLIRKGVLHAHILNLFTI